MRQFLDKLRVFLEMIKFEHSIFALPFAYSGLFLAANGWPHWHSFLWVSIAMVSFRTYAMSLNRIIDRMIDARNPRTKDRALPAGRLTVMFVWLVSVFSLIIFEVSAYQLPTICFKLSWIPSLLALLYPLTKRFTWLSHFVLGIILGIAPYGAWLGEGREFSWTPGCLTLGVSCWVAGFDIIYALQDLDFDKSHQLYSFPSRFGLEAGLVAPRILHGLALFSWIAAGWIAPLGLIYFIGLFLAGLALIRENWLIRSGGMGKLQDAFFKMNAFVSSVLFLSVWFDLLLRRI